MTIILRRLTAVTIAIATILLSGLSSANNKSPTLTQPEADFVKSVTNLSYYYLNQARMAIRMHITPEELKIFDKIDAIIDETDWNVFATRAVNENGKPIIRIPIGFIIASYYLDLAYVEGWRANKVTYIYEYQLKLIPLLGIDPKTRILSNPIQRESLCESAGLEPDHCARDRANPDALQAMYFVRGTTMMFLLAHEAAHHLKGHLTHRHLIPYLQEMEADKFAADMIIKTGGDPFMAINNFVLFAKIDDFKTRQAHIGEAIAPACRFLNAFVAGYESVSNLPNWQEYARQNAISIAEFDKFMSSRELKAEQDRCRQ